MKRAKHKTISPLTYGFTTKAVRLDSSADPRSVMTRDTYDGAEMCRVSTRPGAYDAYDAPSIRNGHEVAYAPSMTSP